LVDTKEESFTYYGAMLVIFYINFKAGTNQENNIFWVEDTDASLSVQCATHAKAIFVRQALLKQVQGNATRFAEIEALELQTLNALGPHPIKQVELYLMSFWEVTCPKPSDEVLAQVKDNSAKTMKTKRIAAKGGDGDAAKGGRNTTQKSTLKKEGRPKARTVPAAERMKAAALAKMTDPDRTNSALSE
jgi:hypothetical protein